MIFVNCDNCFENTLCLFVLVKFFDLKVNIVAEHEIENLTCGVANFGKI